MDTLNLIEKAKAGDEKAFDALIKEHLPHLKNLLHNQFKIQFIDVDDIIQVSAAKAWTKISSFRGDSQFLTWFYSILRNEVMNFLEKKNKIEKHEITTSSLTPFYDNEESESDFLMSKSLESTLEDNAASLLEKRELLETYKIMLTDVINKLSPEHKEIIKLVLEEEHSYKEISEILNVPIGTVMSRLFFAKKYAQSLISKYAERNDIQLPCVGRYK